MEQEGAMTEYLVDTSKKVYANKFVQEITRCRSCLYLANPPEARWCAKLATYIPDADGYCAWGAKVVEP